MSIATEITFRELDHRSGDGIDVRLLWSPQSGRVWVDVRDEQLGGSFRLEVEPSDAMAAFQHPYAYAERPDADPALAA